MKFIQITLSLVFLNFSCQTDNQKQQVESFKNDVKLRPSAKEFTFDLDSLTSENSMTMLLKELDGLEYLFLFNRPTNEILSYNMETKKLVHRVPIATDGTEKIGRISGFQIKNMDSIYVFPIGNSSIFLINGKGKIVSKIKYNAPETQSEGYVISALNSIPDFLSDGSLVLKSMPLANWSTLPNDELQKFNMSYKVILTNGGLKKGKHSFPDSYWKDFKKDIQFSLVSNDSLIVYSLFGDHNVYFASDINEVLRAREAKSEYIVSDFQEIPIGQGREKMLSYFAFSPHYKSIYYDKYRNIYYRFCNIGYDGEFEVEELTHYRKYPKNFSIIVLNDKLEKVDEFRQLNNRKYNIDNVLIGREGMYISTNNPLNKESNEDKLAFELFYFD
jgi:hypothetical protein